MPQVTRIKTTLLKVNEGDNLDVYTCTLWNTTGKEQPYTLSTFIPLNTTYNAGSFLVNGEPKVPTVLLGVLSYTTDVIPQDGRLSIMWTATVS